MPAAAAVLTPELARLLTDGTVIPAHPLALTDDRRLDERAQRALTRYYLASGAGGIAVGVHTTQFAIHRREVGLLEPVLRLACEVLDDQPPERPFLRVAGVLGPLGQAVEEAELAASLGYHAVLLAPGAGAEDELIERAEAVGSILPVIGFYLQEAVGGRYLGVDFWRRFADIPSVVAVKIAPFDRYRTVDAVRGIVTADRGAQVALYTGNDDTIINDLVTPFEFAHGDSVIRRHVVGGLLGQWAVWTSAAVDIAELARQARAGHTGALRSLLAHAAAYTDANGAVFDVRNGFHGCVPGINEVLRRQGLMPSAACLDPEEVLSPGQAQELDRVSRAYPWLVDDAFVEAHRDAWLT